MSVTVPLLIFPGFEYLLAVLVGIVTVFVIIWVWKLIASAIVGG